MVDHDAVLHECRVRFERLDRTETAAQELEVMFRAHMTEMQSSIKHLEQMITRHDRLLLGGNGQIGLDKRTDRLEQSQKSSVVQQRSLWTTVGGMLAGFIGKVLYDVFRN
jgi:hypothetical protein